ncbi:Sensory/regulatory protein RpfC [compost metagenome]
MLRAGVREDRLRCEVFNTGSQIPEALRPDLFTALDHPGTGQKGLGLGLGLSKALVEAHGGTLGVVSTDEGVTAWFEVPLSAGRKEPV